MRRDPHIRWVVHRLDERPEFKTLMDNPRFVNTWRTAKEDRRFRVWPVEVERHNHVRPGEDPSVAEAGPREDGHWDEEGHTCCDVHAYWRLRPWRPSDARAIVRGAIEWVEDTWDLYHPRYLLKYPSAILDALRWTRDTWPLTRHCEGWVWEVNSMKVATEQAAWDKAEEIVEQRRPLRHGERHAREVAELQPSVLASITRDEVEFYLKDVRECTKVSDKLWVSRHDPTVFYFDERYLPFDLKDGWSNEAVARVIQEWCHEMIGETVPVVHDPVR